MKEVKKCSISGIAFTIDVDAYEMLSRYLESLRKSYGNDSEGREIVEDIEARIAELILSSQDNATVVELPLVERIIEQMGTADTICDQSEETGAAQSEGRIPRRLYRDMENARLGGVCSGIGKYFNMNPIWVRAILFAPLLVLLMLGWIPFFWWIVPLMGNLCWVFLICYLIFWFAVPAARTARQKLEQNGQPITAQSIRETSAASNDIDAPAKSVVAKVVTMFGQIVLIFFKILAGVVVFALIMGACALIIGLFVIGVTGPSSSPLLPSDLSIWTQILGILVVLIPVLLLIYVLMCLIASRKPLGKTVLIVFLLWLLTFIGLGVVAVQDCQQHRLGRFNSGWYEDPDMQLPPVEECHDSSLLLIDTPDAKVDMRVDDDHLTIEAGEEDGESVLIRAGASGVQVKVQEADE